MFPGVSLSLSIKGAVVGWGEGGGKSLHVTITIDVSFLTVQGPPPLLVISGGQDWRPCSLEDPAPVLTSGGIFINFTLFLS